MKAQEGYLPRIIWSEEAIREVGNVAALFVCAAGGRQRALRLPPTASHDASSIGTNPFHEVRAPLEMLVVTPEPRLLACRLPEQVGISRQSVCNGKNFRFERRRPSDAQEIRADTCGKTMKKAKVLDFG